MKAVQPVRLALILGGLLFLGLLLEITARFLPAYMPYGLQVLCAQRLLDREIYDHDPQLGHCLKPFFERHTRWAGFSLKLRHAPLPGGVCGYRRSSIQGSAEAGRGRPDMVVLGDSHAYGMEVDEDSTWPSMLGSALSRRVANLGVRMFGTTQSADLYLRYGRGLKPRIVLILLCPNDPTENEVFAAWLGKEGIARPLASDEMMYGVCRTLGLASTPPLCRLAVGFGRTGIVPHLLLGRSIAWLHHWRKPRPEPDGAGMRALFDDLRRLASGLDGARLAVILNEGWSREQRTALVGFLKETHTPWMELSGTRGRGRSVAFDGHWNEAGHKEVASQVLDFLEKADLLRGLRKGGRASR